MFATEVAHVVSQLTNWSFRFLSMVIVDVPLILRQPFYINPSQISSSFLLWFRFLSFFFCHRKGLKYLPSYQLRFKA